MMAHITTIIKGLLESDALKAEWDAIEQDFSGIYTVTAVAITGTAVPLVLNDPQQTYNLMEVKTSPPPKVLQGEWPCAYVYGMNSDYPAKRQEAEIATGIHTVAITLYYEAERAEDAEQGVSRLAFAVKRLLERNQYIFSQIPRAMGRASLAAVPAVAPGTVIGGSALGSAHVAVQIELGELRTL